MNNCIWKIAAMIVLILGLVALVGVQFVNIRNLESNLVTEKSWTVEQGKQIAVLKSKVETLTVQVKDEHTKLVSCEDNHKAQEKNWELSYNELLVQNNANSGGWAVCLEEVQKSAKRYSVEVERHNEHVEKYNKLVDKYNEMREICQRYVTGTLSWYYGR